MSSSDEVRPDVEDSKTHSEGKTLVLSDEEIPNRQMPAVNPGYVMFGASLPFLYRAYRLYHTPIDDLVEHIAKVKSQGQLQNLSQLKDADISLRRAVGFGVAGRALKLGTLISFGSFGLLGAGKKESISHFDIFFICQF